MANSSAKSCLPSEARRDMAPPANRRTVPLSFVVAPAPLTLSTFVALAKAAIGDPRSVDISVDD